jgi:hypothetical protein
VNTFIRTGIVGALIAVPLGFFGVLLVEGGPDVEGWAVFAATMATPGIRGDRFCARRNLRGHPRIAR